MPTPLAIILSNCVAFVIALFGYKLIHRMNRYLAVIYTIVFFVVTCLVLKTPFPAHSLSPGDFKVAPFLLVVSIMATWQLTYAPYVADYSRYLPKETAVSKTFFYTYAGTVISSVWMMILGAILAILIPSFSDEPTKGLSMVVGHQFSVVIDLLIILGTVSGTPIGFYGAFMSLITTIEPFTKLRGTPKVRFWLMLCVVTLCTSIPIWAASNFLHNFSNFLTILEYFMVPWTAINLCDFYFVRKSEYDVQDMFDVNGQYGRFNWIAIISYIVGSLIEIPFANTSMYVGPIAKALGGADVAWIFGLVVSTVLYYYPMKRMLKSQKEFVQPIESEIR
jgi:NCS1 family nucleobase:cation symporter-1